MTETNPAAPSPLRKDYESPQLEHFKYSHLPAHLQAVSKPFAELAERMNDSYALTCGVLHRKWGAGFPDEAVMRKEARALEVAGIEIEKTLARLLEAKDAAVRSAVVLAKVS